MEEYLPKSKFIIYGLIDPRNNELRYVGQTKRGMVRVREHMKPSNVKNATGHHGEWLRKLSSQKINPKCIILQDVGKLEGLNDAEIWNIIYYQSLGCQLTNSNLGGDGQLLCSDEVREKFRFAAMNRSKETRHNMRMAQLGKKLLLKQNLK